MITGRCECGKVSFEIDGEIEDFSHCHCSQCRRMHGAAFASFAGVNTKNFSYKSGEDDFGIYESSSDHKRVFCKTCGSNILVALDDYPDMLYVAMGVIDGDPKLPEEYHIYVGSKAPWYKIHGDSAQYEEDTE